MKQWFVSHHHVSLANADRNQGIPNSSPPESLASLLSKSLGGVTIVQKGATDIIAYERPDGAKDIYHVDTPAALKRCGGQGDVLSGAVGTFLAWGKAYEEGSWTTEG